MTIEQALAWLDQHSSYLADQQLNSADGDAMWLMILQALYQVFPERYAAALISAVVRAQSKFNQGESA